MTDQQLIHALQQGQEPAFRLLVETYKDRLYHTILGFLQHPHDAEDVLQDVFIKVYEHIAGFKGEAALSTWMYRIAVTQSLDALRKKNRKKRAGSLLSWLGVGGAQYGEDRVADTVHPGVVAENKEQAAALFHAMKQLPDNQRTAFVLQKVEGLSQQEIAQVMELKEGAVESLLSRAKQNLRKTLTSFYNE